MPMGRQARPLELLVGGGSCTLRAHTVVASSVFDEPGTALAGHDLLHAWTPVGAKAVQP